MADKTALQEALEALPSEQKVGLDTNRIWATSVQVIPSDDFVFLVFRDQIALTIMDENNVAEGEQILLKNVASVVLPTKSALQLSNIIKNVLAKEAGEDGAANA